MARRRSMPARASFRASSGLDFETAQHLVPDVKTFLDIAELEVPDLIRAQVSAGVDMNDQKLWGTLRDTGEMLASILTVSMGTDAEGFGVIEFAPTGQRASGISNAQLANIIHKGRRKSVTGLRDEAGRFRKKRDDYEAARRIAPGKRGVPPRRFLGLSKKNRAAFLAKLMARGLLQTRRGLPGT